MTRFMLNVRRLGIRMTADRKRFAVLCLVTAIGLLFWTRLIVVKRIGRTALAEQEIVETASATPTSVNTPIVTIVLPARPTRDPFAIDPAVFPVEVPQDDAAAAQRADPTVVDPRETLAAMRLEASMPPSLAVIDGVTRRRSDRVPGSAGINFELVEIRSRSVVLMHAGDRYLLRME